MSEARRYCKTADGKPSATDGGRRPCGTQSLPSEPGNVIHFLMYEFNSVQSNSILCI